MVTNARIQTTTFVIGACLAIGYIVYTLYPSIAGPRVAVVRPVPYAVSGNGGLTLVGNAHHFATLYMNGRRIVTRTDGTFEERMLLAQGSNTFILTAEDTFGHTTTQEVTVVYTPNDTKTEEETARIVPLDEVLSF